MKHAALLVSLAAFSAQAAPALEPGLELGVYGFVSANTRDQVPACTDCSVRFQFAASGDVNLTIARHLLLDVGFVSTIGLGGGGYPDAKLVSFRADYLLFDDILTPYAGAGAGYLWQDIVTPLDHGTLSSASGGAAVFEAGVLLRDPAGAGRVSLCAQFVLPFFSVPVAAFIGPPTESVTVPFFLFGLKLGL